MKIATEYEAGEMLTGELKSICIETLQNMVLDFQQVSHLFSEILLIQEIQTLRDQTVSSSFLLFFFFFIGGLRVK